MNKNKKVTVMLNKDEVLSNNTSGRHGVRAFTLIELLVVVLIIGILSAIALPQYTIAVEKSRMAEALQNMTSLQRAIDIYLMENGWPSSEERVRFLGKNSNASGYLNIDLESVLDCTQDEGTRCGSKYFIYDASCGSSSCEVDARRAQNGSSEAREEYELEWHRWPDSGSEWNKYCRIYDDYSAKICMPLYAQGWED